MARTIDGREWVRSVAARPGLIACVAQAGAGKSTSLRWLLDYWPKGRILALDPAWELRGREGRVTYWPTAKRESVPSWAALPGGSLIVIDEIDILAQRRPDMRFYLLALLNLARQQDLTCAWSARRPASVAAALGMKDATEVAHSVLVGPAKAGDLTWIQQRSPAAIAAITELRDGEMVWIPG